MGPTYSCLAEGLKMRICYVGRDGGKDSTVWGFWPIEIKSLFSVALLCFENGSREAYHNHAFNSVSWLLKGRLGEHVHKGGLRVYLPSLKPIFTPRDCMHRVASHGRSWVITFRGPWKDTWKEWLPAEHRERTLTHGRVEV